MQTAIDRREREADRRRVDVLQLLFAWAATIATLVLFNVAQSADAHADVASGSPATAGFAADDPWTPPPDPGPTNPGWSSQSDPGWNADPGWDFQPAPEN